MASTGKKVSISKALAPIPGTPRTLQIKWSIPSAWKSEVDHVNVYWHEKLQYTDSKGKTTTSWTAVDGNPQQFKPSVTTAEFSAKNHCVAVYCTITPIAEYKKGSTKDRKWKGESIGAYNGSSTSYYFSKCTIPTLSAPTAEQIEGTNQIEITVEIDDSRVSKVKFRKAKITKTGLYDDYAIFGPEPYYSTTQRARYLWHDAGGGCTYKFQAMCCDKNGNWQDEWGPWSSEIHTAPSQTVDLLPPTVTRLSTHSVRVSWPNDNFKTHELSVVTDTADWNTDKEKLYTVTDTNHYDLDISETGDLYIFRYRRVNDSGKGNWSNYCSITLGLKPDAPTVWDGSSTMEKGTKNKIYWTHSPRDNSKETQWEIQFTITKAGETTPKIVTESGSDSYTTDPYDPEKTHEFELDTSLEKYGITGDCRIQYKVRTMGIVDEWSDYSTEHLITVWAPQSISLYIKNSSGTITDTITSLPIKINCTYTVSTQPPVSWHVLITNLMDYYVTDDYGETVLVLKDSTVFNKYYDENKALDKTLSASELTLVGGIQYKVTVTAAFTSGISKTATAEFSTNFESQSHIPTASISIDTDHYVASVTAWCADDDTGALIDDVLISIYRRNFDGTFTRLAENATNDARTVIVDSHPALDYARYRICAKSTVDGSVNFVDISEYIGEKAAVITWNENEPRETADDSDEIGWTGSILKLQYNVDVQDSTNIDSSLVKYIGRKHPVAYYGTQLGFTSSWSADIPKNDTETLDLIRLLQMNTTPVYVREGYGTGYWAKVDVSYSIKHKEVTIPVTLSITRTDDDAESGSRSAVKKYSTVTYTDNITGLDFEIDSSGYLIQDPDSKYSGGNYYIAEGEIGVEN